MNVRALYPRFSSDRAVSHIVVSLCGGMQCPEYDLRLMTLASMRRARRSYTREAIPGTVFKVASRLVSDSRLARFMNRRFLDWLDEVDIAYLWPGVAPEVYEQVKRRGHRLIVERINCHRGTAKPILDDAYARLGWPVAHTITEADIAGESAKLEMADFIFSPSPNVERSLLKNGVPEGKVLSSSYGWEPRRIGASNNRALPPAEGLTVAFVGLIGVRKGAPTLLRAWARAGIRGRLVLAGRVEPILEQHCGELLSRPDVVRLGHVDDIGAVYRSSDVFVFPSLEEGDPLVTNEAMANGLPVIVTPMGAGRIGAGGEGGAIIVSPHDEEAIILALRRLERDVELRKELSEQARRRAQEFTWQQVGQQRSRLLCEALAHRPAREPFRADPVDGSLAIGADVSAK